MSQATADSADRSARTMPPEEVIKVVQKLLNLADLEKSKTTEAEAALALERAHDLLRKHHLEMADVESAAGKMQATTQVEEGKVAVGNKNWSVDLACALARANYCYPLVGKRLDEKTGRWMQHVLLIGRQENILLVKETSPWLADTLGLLAYEATHAMNFYDRGQRTHYRNSFMAGAVDRMIQRLNRMRRDEEQKDRAAAEGSSTALTIVFDAENQQFLTKRYPNLGVRKVSRSQVDMGAYGRGWDAAATVPTSKLTQVGN